MTSVHTMVNRLLGKDEKSDSPCPCPWWPPDLFAVTAHILRASGAYRKLVGLKDECHPEHKQVIEYASNWLENINQIELRGTLKENKQRSILGKIDTVKLCRLIPTEISDLWNILFSHNSSFLF